MQNLVALAMICKSKSHTYPYTEVEEIAEIAQLDAAILMNCLTKGDHNWRYTDTDSDLDAISASKIRNALCRTMYGRLFTWIVGKINESLKVSKVIANCGMFGLLLIISFTQCR